MHDSPEVHENPYQPPNAASQPPAPATIAPRFPDRLKTDFNGVLPFEDVWKAHNRVAIRTPHFVWVIVLLVGGMAVAGHCALPWFHEYKWIMTAILGLLALGWLVDFCKVLYWRRCARLRQGPFTQAERRLDEKGVHWITNDRSELFQWRGFVAHETFERIVLLVTRNGELVPVYRSMFPDLEVWQLFVAWVAESYPAWPKESGGRARLLRAAALPSR